MKKLTMFSQNPGTKLFRRMPGRKRFHSKRIWYYSVFLSLLLLFFCTNAGAENYELYSPDKAVKITIHIEDTLTYSVLYKSDKVLLKSPLLLKFSQSPPLGRYLKVSKREQKTVDNTWEDIIGQQRMIRNFCNELHLEMLEKRFPGRKLEMYFRAYNDGIAFRYMMPEMQESTLWKNVLTGEYSTFHFPANYTAWIGECKSYMTSQESEYWERPLSHIKPTSLIGVPLTIKHSNNLYTAITEANLNDWSGMFLNRDENVHNGICLKVNLASIDSKMETSGKVKITPPHYSPWRVVLIGETPGELVESNIILNLSDSCEIADKSWIQPDMCAWDRWWSGVEKMDTETMKKFIKLASDMGWTYQLIDGGWYQSEPEPDVTKPVPELDLEQVLKYAKDNNVKCWLWTHWKHIDKQMEEAFALYEKWGIVGVKIDFMVRNGQDMVNWYRKTVETASKYHLMINFHGAYKPTGMRRTFPNLMTREGVLGNEYHKGSDRVTPEHDVTIPFTRMLAGPMDYTPGGFLNRGMGEFKAGSPTQVMGTRCHTLAKFVVFFSPVTTVCDHPDHYYDQPGIEFLQKVPTAWDETRVLNGNIGEYITIARRSGDTWFIGSMTNSEERTLQIPLDFLGTGEYTAHNFKDMENDVTNLIREKQKLNNKEKIKIHMQPGGGFVSYLVPVKK